MFTARLSQPKLWLLFFHESQHIKVSNPCRSVNILLTPNLCFDSTSPCVVKKHHSLLCVCKAWFLSIRQAYLDFNHKGKSLWLPKSKNAISYFSIMHTSWYAQNLLWSILLVLQSLSLKMMCHCFILCIILWLMFHSEGA